MKISPMARKAATKASIRMVETDNESDCSIVEQETQLAILSAAQPLVEALEFYEKQDSMLINSVAVIALAAFRATHL